MLFMVKFNQLFSIKRSVVKGRNWPDSIIRNKAGYPTICRLECAFWGVPGRFSPGWGGGKNDPGQPPGAFSPGRDDTRPWVGPSGASGEASLYCNPGGTICLIFGFWSAKNALTVC